MLIRPPRQDGWKDEDPAGDAVLLTLVPTGPQTPAPRGTQQPAENLPQPPDLARDLFELQHRRPGLKRRRSPQKKNSWSQNTGQDVWDQRRQGTGQEATHRNFLGPNSLRPPTNKGPRGAVQQQGPLMPTQNSGGRKLPGDPQWPNREGKGGVEGRDWRWRRIGNCLCNAYTVTRTPTVHWTR